MQNAPPTDRTVLVTGGAGFIGSHLVEALVPDNEVRVLDSLATGEREHVPAEATFVEGDVRDADALATAAEGVDIIFHEAALVSVERSIEAPIESHAINVDATLSLLEHARDIDARVVCASSAAIYGHPDRVPVVETDPKTPTSPYGLEKLTVDHYVRQYHDLYGLDTVALRYFNVYGPRQRPNEYSGVISIFLDQAVNDEPVTVHGDGSQTRDFVFVGDVVRANLHAATAKDVGNAYNVGSGESISIRELAETIVELTDSSSDIVHTEGRDGDVRDSQADITAARESFGYEPTVSLRDGLERTAEWYTDSERS